jgi:hypothetical protein
MLYMMNDQNGRVGGANLGDNNKSSLGANDDSPEQALLKNEHLA